MKTLIDLDEKERAVLADLGGFSKGVRKLIEFFDENPQAFFDWSKEKAAEGEYYRCSCCDKMKQRENMVHYLWDLRAKTTVGICMQCKTKIKKARIGCVSHFLKSGEK